MAFDNSSFNLWTDAGLTSVFSGTYSITHKTDLSDNPQDFVLYLGSVLEERQLQAASSPGVASITLTPTYILPQWTANTVYIVGDKIEPITPNGYVYRCTTAGTSHATTEPTFPTVTIGTTVTDGTAVWELYAARHPITEIKLALTSGGLSSATGGAALDVATTLAGGVDNLQEIHIRVTNTVETVSNNTGNEEIALVINACIETAVD